MRFSREQIGELLTLGNAMAWGLLPILLIFSNNNLPPFFYAGISMLIAGIITFFQVWSKGKVKEIINKQALPFMMAGTFFIAIICFPLSFLIGQKINPGDFSILDKSTIIFSLLFFGLLKLETISSKRIIGGILILGGILIILFRDFTGQISLWYLALIIIRSISVFASYFQKRSVQIVSQLSYLCFRSLIASIFVLSISFCFEDISLEAILTQKNIILILANSLIFFYLAQIFFLGAIARIDISKFSLIAGTSPIFTLIFSFFFFGHIPTLYQTIGLIIVLIGIWQIIEKKNPSNNFLKGTIVKGFGKAKGFIKIYSDKLEKELGFKPYLGTLNVKLGPKDFKIRKKMIKEFHNSLDKDQNQNKLQINKNQFIKEFELNGRKFGRVYYLKANIIFSKNKKSLPCAILFPKKTEHTDDIIEVVCGEKIEEKRIIIQFE